MGIKLDSKKPFIAWLIGGSIVIGFISGFAFDIDHPIAWFLGISNGRFLHEIFAVGSLLALIIGLGWFIALVVGLKRSRFLR